MPLPKRVEHRQPKVRRDLAAALRSAVAGLALPPRRKDKSAEFDAVAPEILALRGQLRAHPAHQEPGRDARVRVAERYLRVERDNAQLRKKAAAATNSLARTFDRIVGLLSERGFIAGAGDEITVTPDGRLLARIYSESDLLVAECLRTGAWTGLDPAELAAACSAVLFESRGGDGPSGPYAAEAPTARLRTALHAIRRISQQLRTDERQHRINQSREPDDGFVAAVFRWARSADLSAALAAADTAGNGAGLSAGDFVRWCRQILDLLDQIRVAGPDPELRSTAKRAITAIRCGVVAVDAG